jgi:antitoxin HicB
MSTRTFKALLRRETEGGYTAMVPSLPGCVTFGESVEHAIEMVREAIALYIESLRANGEELLEALSD